MWYFLRRFAKVVMFITTMSASLKRIITGKKKAFAPSNDRKNKTHGSRSLLYRSDLVSFGITIRSMFGATEKIYSITPTTERSDKTSTNKLSLQRKDKTLTIAMKWHKLLEQNIHSETWNRHNVPQNSQQSGSYAYLFDRRSSHSRLARGRWLQPFFWIPKQSD